MIKQFQCVLYGLHIYILFCTCVVNKLLSRYTLILFIPKIPIIYSVNVKIMTRQGGPFSVRYAQPA